MTWSIDVAIIIPSSHMSWPPQGSRSYGDRNVEPEPLLDGEIQITACPVTLVMQIPVPYYQLSSDVHIDEKQTSSAQFNTGPWESMQPTLTRDFLQDQNLSPSAFLDWTHKSFTAKAAVPPESLFFFPQYFRPVHFPSFPMPTDKPLV